MDGRLTMSNASAPWQSIQNDEAMRRLRDTDRHSLPCSFASVPCKSPLREIGIPLFNRPRGHPCAHCRSSTNASCVTLPRQSLAAHRATIDFLARAREVRWRMTNPIKDSFRLRCRVAKALFQQHRHMLDLELGALDDPHARVEGKGRQGDGHRDVTERGDIRGRCCCCHGRRQSKSKSKLRKSERVATLRSNMATNEHEICLCVYMCMCVGVHVCCVYVCMCACVYVCMYVCMRVCIYVSMYACMFVWMCVCLYVYM